MTEQQLTPVAKANIAKLLHESDLTTAATWPDRMRGAKDAPIFWTQHAATWHYADVPRDSNYANSPKNPQGDAVQAMQAFTAILKQQPIPAGPVEAGMQLYFNKLAPQNEKVQQFALRFLIHIVADLHQPLHFGYSADHGGNNSEVLWFGDKRNLHNVWDTLLISQSPRSENAYIQHLTEQLNQLSPTELQELADTDPEVWLREAQALLGKIYAWHNTSAILTDDYFVEFGPTVDQQLLKASVRTATILNALFADGGP
jgi:S1/P1 Nuclease